MNVRFTRALNAAIKAQASLRLSHIGSETQATDQFYDQLTGQLTVTVNQ